MDMPLQLLIIGIATGSAYALISSGFTLIYGILGIIQFAHGEVYMLGAYFGYLICLRLGFHYLVSIPLGIAGAAIIGLIIEKIVFRPLRSAPKLSMMTVSLGLSFTLLNAALIIFGPEAWEYSSPYNAKILKVGSFNLSEQRLMVIILSIGLMVLLHLIISRTAMGKAIRASAQDFEVAWMLGIDPNRISRFVFLIGSALAGAAGVLIAPVLTVMPFIGETALIKAFIIVVIGGFGSIKGAIVASFFIAVVESFTAGYLSPNYQNVVTFLVMFLFLLFKPSGLFGEGPEESL